MRPFPRGKYLMNGTGRSASEGGRQSHPLPRVRGLD